MTFKFKFNKVIKWFKEESFKRLINNSGTLLVGETGASLINMITLVLLLKIIKAEEYGIIVLVQSYSLIIDQLFNFQSWQAFIKYGAEDIANKDDQSLNNLLKQGVIFDLSTAVLGTLVALLLADIVGNLLSWDQTIIHYSRLYSLSILFHFSGIPIGILRLFNKFRYFSYQKITVAMMKLIGIIIAFLLNLNFINIIWIYLITDIFGHLFLIIAANKILIKNDINKWWKPKIKFRKDFLSYTIWTNLSSTITIPSKQLDVFIVSSTLSLELVGIYKVFKQITSLLGRLVNPLYQAIYPELAVILAENNIKKAIKTSLKVSFILTLVIVPLVFIGGILSPLWLRVFFDSTFSEYWILFFIYLTYVGMDIISAPTHPLFNALGYAKQKFIIMGVGNIAYLFFAWVLGHNFGLIGIINSYGIQFIIITTLKILYIKFRTKRIYIG